MKILELNSARSHIISLGTRLQIMLYYSANTCIYNYSQKSHSKFGETTIKHNLVSHKIETTAPSTSHKDRLRHWGRDKESGESETEIELQLCGGIKCCITLPCNALKRCHQIVTIFHLSPRPQPLPQCLPAHDYYYISTRNINFGLWIVMHLTATVTVRCNMLRFFLPHCSSILGLPQPIGIFFKEASSAFLIYARKLITIVINVIETGLGSSLDTS